MTRGVSVGEAMRRAARDRLAHLDSPARDARALMLHALQIDAAALILRERDPLSPDAAARFEALVTRRVAHEPVSKIIGIRAFYGLDFAVSPDVLDPRADSETLIDAALDWARGAQQGRALRLLDLGTGSGCLLLSLLHHLPGATGLGVDASEKALDIARQNAKRLHLEEKARFIRSDWLEKVDGAFDLVVCNPPYIGDEERADLSNDVLLWDPKEALFADENGLAAYRRIASTLGKALSETGTAFFEIGSGQDEAVPCLFAAHGFEDITFRRDIAGIRRCMILRRRKP